MVAVAEKEKSFSLAQTSHFGCNLNGVIEKSQLTVTYPPIFASSNSRPQGVCTHTARSHCVHDSYWNFCCCCIQQQSDWKKNYIPRPSQIVLSIKYITRFFSLSEPLSQKTRYNLQDICRLAKILISLGLIISGVV